MVERPLAGGTGEVFRALADPTRRRILDLLAEHGTQSVGQLAGEFPDLVASGISKHLMALRAAGLVSSTRQGRNQLYRVEGERLSTTIGAWLVKYERYWAGSLEALRELAEAGAPPDDGT